jgi:predicted transcriptional regulator
MPESRTNPTHTTLSVRVPLAMRDKVDRVADSVGLTRSALMLRAIRTEVQRLDRVVPRRAA